VKVGGGVGGRGGAGGGVVCGGRWGGVVKTTEQGQQVCENPTRDTGRIWRRT